MGVSQSLRDKSAVQSSEEIKISVWEIGNPPLRAGFSGGAARDTVRP
jgi:hypothetical protein